MCNLSSCMQQMSTHDMEDTPTESLRGICLTFQGRKSYVKNWSSNTFNGTDKWKLSTKTTTEQQKRVFYLSLDVQLSWDSRINTEVKNAALKGHKATQKNLC